MEPGQAIALSAGTTTWRLAHHLAAIPDLTVVTNSMQVAIVLHRQARPDLTVVLIGGVRTPSDALVGPIAVAALRSLHVDMLFMGVHGMAVDSGLTTPNLLEADTNKAMIETAEQLAVVVDHTKWGVRGLSRMAELGEAQVLVDRRGPRRRTRSPSLERARRPADRGADRAVSVGSPQRGDDLRGLLAPGAPEPAR